MSVKSKCYVCFDFIDFHVHYSFHIVYNYVENSGKNVNKEQTMLLSFNIKNWRVFKDECTLSMLATRERLHNSTCAVLAPMYGGQRVLPTAAIYGPNAAGKTTLLEALSLIKSLVVDGTQVNQTIPVVPFLLDPKTKNEPTKFALEMLIAGKVFRYELLLSKSAVEKEQLSILRSRGGRMVFKRERDDFGFGKEYDNDRHRLIAENTRNNQLFLHNAVSQNAMDFFPVYNWFASSLVIVGVDAQYEQYSQMLLRSDFKEFINEKLRRYQTGIEEIVLDEVPLESIPVPQDLVKNFLLSAPADATANLQIRINKGNTNSPEIFIIQREPGKDPAASKVRLRHRSKDGSLVRFELENESKGTQRLIELLPLFFDMAQEAVDGLDDSKVYLVDELDRSFHSALSEDLIREYLKNCSSLSHHQLIFTTHDLMLMESDALRKDELWLCEKDSLGAARLTRIGGMSGVRTDTDVLNKYRKGAIGDYPYFETTQYGLD